MNDTVKKSNIYTAQISREDTAAITIYVRAESRAQARSYVANTMITVELADQDTLLGLRREDVIDARHPPAPDQLPLPGVQDAPDAGAPPPQTAAEAMEASDG